MKEVCDFLKKCQTYYLATVDGTFPEVRPFGTATLYQNRLYLQTGKKKEVYRQIQKNPHIAICAFDGKSWLRIKATLIEDDSLEAQEAVMNDYPDLRSMYQAGDGNTAVFYLSKATAVFSSFTEKPKTVTF
jgi:uncharacterized pyridoxamine 5'-phosphate oxidase family protein